jgi:hypothetical protein
MTAMSSERSNDEDGGCLNASEQGLTRLRLEGESAKRLSNVTTCDLSLNELHGSLRELRQMPHLAQLFLDANLLDERTEWPALKNLRVLSISHNRFGQLSATLHGLRDAFGASLAALNLTGNAICPPDLPTTSIAARHEYKCRIVASLPSLRNLDAAPISRADRLTANAWIESRGTLLDDVVAVAADRENSAHKATEAGAAGSDAVAAVVRDLSLAPYHTTPHTVVPLEAGDRVRLLRVAASAPAGATWRWAEVQRAADSGTPLVGALPCASLVVVDKQIVDAQQQTVGQAYKEKFAIASAAASGVRRFASRAVTAAASVVTRNNSNGSTSSTSSTSDAGRATPEPKPLGSPLTGVSGRRTCELCRSRKPELRVTLDEVTRKLCATCAARLQREHDQTTSTVDDERPRCQECQLLPVSASVRDASGNGVRDLCVSCTFAVVTRVDQSKPCERCHCAMQFMRHVEPDGTVSALCAGCIAESKFRAAELKAAAEKSRRPTASVRPTNSLIVFNTNDLMQQQKDGKTLHRPAAAPAKARPGAGAAAGEQLELSREIREHFDNIQRVGTMDEQTMRARQPFAKQDREAKKKAAAGAEQAAAEAAMVASDRFVNQRDDAVALDSLPSKASAETALAFRIVLATIDGAAASGESGMPSRSDLRRLLKGAFEAGDGFEPSQHKAAPPHEKLDAPAFRRLLERLVRAQAKAESTTIATPSGASRWLLERVATRSGVDAELHMTLGMLAIVRRCIAFDASTQTTLSKLLNRKRSALLLTLQGADRELLADVVRVLVAHEREYLASFRTCYPDNLPRGSLAALLEASMRVMAMQRALATNALAVENPRSAMQDYVGGAVQRSAELEIERCVMEVESIVARERHCAADSVVGARQQAAAALRSVRGAPDRDSRYRKDFADYCEIDKLYARTFQRGAVERLADELRELPASSLGMYVFPLASKLHRFFNGLRGVDSKLAAPDLATPFRPFVLHWITENTTTLINWAKKACVVDRWEPFDTNVSSSSSVVDVFQSCAELINVLARHDFLTHTAHGDAYTAVLGDVIVSKTLQTYCDELLRVECATLSATADELQRFRAAGLLSAPPSRRSRGAAISADVAELRAAQQPRHGARHARRPRDADGRRFAL